MMFVSHSQLEKHLVSVLDKIRHSGHVPIDQYRTASNIVPQQKQYPTTLSYPNYR